MNALHRNRKGDCVYVICVVNSVGHTNTGTCAGISCLFFLADAQIAQSCYLPHVQSHAHSQNILSAVLQANGTSNCQKT